MHLECPHCQAHYDINTDIDDAIFVCHRCGKEFSPGSADSSDHSNDVGILRATLPWEPAEQGFPPPPWLTAPPVALQTGPSEHRDGTMAEGTGDACAPDTEPTESRLAPERKQTHLFAWFMVMLIIIAASGFRVQQDAWMDNRWFRSTLINFGVSLPMRDKDWHIIPESVRPEWISRNDGSRALLIRGRLQNLMASEMPLPAIEITFFSRLEPEQVIGSTRYEITTHPTNKAINAAPFQKPARDTMPVGANGSREFVLLLESVPQDSGDFTLAVRTSPE